MHATAVAAVGGDGLDIGGDPRPEEGSKPAMVSTIGGVWDMPSIYQTIPKRPISFGNVPVLSGFADCIA